MDAVDRPRANLDLAWVQSIQEISRDDALAFLTEQLGEAWVSKSASEVTALLKETNWYKTRVKLADEFRH